MSRTTAIIIAGILAALFIVFLIWQTKKYDIVDKELREAVAEQTDSLYHIHYDSLFFDEISGTAYLENIKIKPDTFRIRDMKVDDMPVAFVDVEIGSINVTGVQTDKAITGNYLIGDSLFIHNPIVTVYFARPINKQTKVDIEAKKLYEKILGDMKLIKVSHVIILNAQVKGTNFFTGDKEFSCEDADIKLAGVSIDSVHNFDTTRTLFCKEADVSIKSLATFNKNRREFEVKGVAFSGEDNFLTLDTLQVNTIGDNKDSSKLLIAEKITLQGLNANVLLKDKNITLSKVGCKHITVFEGDKLKVQYARPKNMQSDDTSGFRHSYSVNLALLQFPSIRYIQRPDRKFKIGKVGLKITGLAADEIIKAQNDPFDHSREIEISCDQILLNSKHEEYKNSLNGIVFNSLKKNLTVRSFIIHPYLGEKQFAAKSTYQRDRYDVAMRGIEVQGINLDNIFEQNIIANKFIVENASASIYRDLQKPLKNENKIGNYPSQLIEKLDVPLDVDKAIFKKVFIEYKEKEEISDSTGVVRFANSRLTLDNITNVPSSVNENKFLTIEFTSNILGKIPIAGQFKFDLSDTSGRFTASAKTNEFDAAILNEVSVPMALVRINSGKIDELKFNFKGNNTRAGGPMVMKYHDFKIDVLKNDEEKNTIKKKGLTSLFANIIVINDNPRNGELRKVSPSYDRDLRKSFFNLVWKTIFTGMQKTVGIPGK